MFYLKFCVHWWKKRLFTTRQMIHCFYPPPPNNLVDPPPLCYRNRKCNSIARPKIDASKSASEHNFSGVGCNVRVFQGISPWANTIQGFQGLPGFVGHPVNSSLANYNVYCLHLNLSKMFYIETFVAFCTHRDQEAWSEMLWIPFYSKISLKE